MRFEITRTHAAGFNELDPQLTYVLGTSEAIVLVGHLGYNADLSDNGSHTWYGTVGYGNFARPLMLTIDRWGDAVVAVHATGLARLFPRALEELVQESAADITLYQAA